MEVLEWPNGICQKHGAKLNVNGVPKCVKCEADAERASRAPAPVVAIQDPGHEAMTGIVADGKQHVKAQAVDKSVNSKQSPVPANVHTLADRLQFIRDQIYGLPMPRSIKSYKRFQKIQELIDQALHEEQENAEAD